MIEPKDPEYQDKDTLTLELDDGISIECIVVSIFKCDGRQYIALLPMNLEGYVEEDSPVFLYRYRDLGGDEVDLQNIEDDDEYDRVSDAYDEFLDDEEFDELFS